MSNLVEAHNLIEKALKDLEGYQNHEIIEIASDLSQIKKRLADIIW